MVGKKAKSAPQSDWETRMAAAQAGDNRAYASVLTDISRYVRGYLHTKVASSDDVEDILQEILSSIHKARHTYEPSRPLKPWVIAITSFRLNDYFRKIYRNMEREVADYDSMEFALGTDDVTEQRDAYESIHSALEQLPEKQQQLIRRVKLEGYSIKEVANELSMTEAAVKVAVHRAYKQLQTIVKANEVVE